MSTKRIMSGVANLSGQKVNTLRVGEMISRKPSPRYVCVCSRCGAKSSYGQRQLATGTARCLASDCGKEQLRAQLAETPRKISEREAAKKRAEAHAVENSLRVTANKIAQTVRERIEKGRDDQLFVTPELRNASMPSSKSAEFNKEQAAIFIRETPEYREYQSDETLNLIGQYFERNGVCIADSAMIRAAFFRLRDYGLLTPRVTPDERSQQEQVEAEAPVITPVEVQPANDGTMTGFDPETGVEREFSAREIDRMSADQFRRIFRIYRSELGIPNVGPGTWRRA